MDEDVYKNCIKVLNTCQSDNDRFAALLTVVKVVKADECDPRKAREILEAIGARFMIKLLKTGTSPEGCSNYAFKLIAVSIISSLCSVKGFFSQVQSHNSVFSTVVPHLVEIVKTNETNSTEEDTALDLVTECYDCLMTIAVDKTGTLIFLRSGSVSIVCQAVFDKCIVYERGISLLLYLCGTFRSQVWDTAPEGLANVVERLMLDIEKHEDEKKFQLCSTLSAVLMSANTEQIEKMSISNWKQELHRILFHLLQNKLGSVHRSHVLKLCSVMVEECGVKWALMDQGLGPKSLLLMVHLACIEVRMCLEADDLSKICLHENLLASCYSILEHVIAHLIEGPTLELQDKQVAQLHSAMVGAFNSIINFLSRVDGLPGNELQVVMPVVIASIRVLGSWIAEETTALREEVIILLPFLLKISVHSFRKCAKQEPNKNDSLEDELERKETLKALEEAIANRKSIESITDMDIVDSSIDSNGGTGAMSTEELVQNELCSTSSKSSQATNELLEATKKKSPNNQSHDSTVNENPWEQIQNLETIELLQFLMPGFCHLSADDASRTLMLTFSLPSVMIDYLGYQWQRLKRADGSSCSNKEPAIALTTACGVMLNIIVLESHSVPKRSLYGELLKFSSTVLSELQEIREDLVMLQYNVMVIGLLIIRKRYNLNDISQGTMENFFKDCTKLLKIAHDAIVGPDNGKAVLGFHANWSDFSDLWGLAIQILCECLHETELPWLPKTILTTKWLSKACQMLQDVKAESVPKDVQTAYMELFSNLTSESPMARKVFKDMGMRRVTRKYQMTKLKEFYA